MYLSFKTTRRKTDTDFSKFIQLRIAQETSYNLIIDEIPLELNGESFRNIFYYKNLEVNIERVDLKTYKIDIYPINKSSNIKFKFGCELETCLNMYCTKNNKIKISDTFVKLKSDPKMELSYWSELLFRYIYYVIVPMVTKDFLNLFPIAYVSLKPKSGYSDFRIDMKDGTVIEERNPIFYNSLVFTRDSSLVCSDTTNKPIDFSKNLTLHCEIVTPILKSYEELQILYNTLIKPGCLNYNQSTAFHINVSMYDESNKPIYFSNGLIDAFMDKFEVFEDQIFKELDDVETPYATKIYNYSQYYTLAKYRDMIYMDNGKDFTFENFIEGEKFYRCYLDLDEKYNSIYKKSPTLVEFRLFPSSGDQEDLLRYVKGTFDVLTKSYKEFYENYKQIMENLQSKNLRAKIDFSIIKEYNGKLYYEDKKFPKLNDVNPFDIKELSEGLKFLFGKRHQHITEPIKISRFLYKVVDGNKNIYDILINIDGTVNVSIV